ncbi:pyruvate dehydrogenase (acetyl-transferring) E1 component subunit alpha [Scopulibacillus cellulosilyticus]|uniref:Pyruvate dehydrogenase E1 component subunit alpha n=1 Tax=Scopulibacillus cellulosilyticus TaxID=2665665 RepID=A0ABW2PXA6_9BACL
MIDEQQLQIEMVQLLDETGDYNPIKIKSFDNQLLLSMYKWMLKARQFDIRMVKLQRQGRIGTYAPFQGQEAAQIGSALALEKDDWMFPSYREVAATLVHGATFKQNILRSKGNFGVGGSTDENIFPIQIIIGAQTLHAAGCAWASKLKGEKVVSACYFGDGATSQGDFHEALNFASVNQVPAVFFCQNNQWAISVPRNKQTASRSIAQKALAYGMKGVQVDGNDCLAVYQVMKAAADSARNGDGPTLIEAITYRQGPHTTADDPTKYRSERDAEAWQNKDPLVRFKRFLTDNKLWSEEKERDELQTIKNDIDQAVKAAEETPPPTLDEIFDHVYDKPHELLLMQKEEAKAFIKERV